MAQNLKSCSHFVLKLHFIFNHLSQLQVREDVQVHLEKTANKLTCIE